MSSRMSKYYEEPENLVTRSSRNESLYKEISKSELDNYSISSNATVLGDNKDNIDVDKIKKILDTRYNSVPKRRTIEIEEEPEEVIEREDTKEYDINAILQKAKKDKVVSYEEERLKKLRDTQFNILNELNIDGHNKEIEEKEVKNDDLMSLINTITFNEVHKNDKDTDPLDILTDLKGEDNTEVFDALKEEIDNEIFDNSEEEKAKNLINSFYTQSNKLVSNDFVDESEFKDIDENNNVLVKVLIFIIVIAIIVGIGFVVKTILL